MEEKQINIMDLVMLAWHRLWIIVLAAVVCAAGAFSYCKFFLTPSYSVYTCNKRRCYNYL